MSFLGAVMLAVVAEAEPQIGNPAPGYLVCQAEMVRQAHEEALTPLERTVLPFCPAKDQLAYLVIAKQGAAPKVAAGAIASSPGMAKTLSDRVRRTIAWFEKSPGALAVLTQSSLAIGWDNPAAWPLSKSVQQTLSELPSFDRQCYLLVDLLGFSEERTATELKAKARAEVHRARLRARAAIRRQGPADLSEWGLDPDWESQLEGKLAPNERTALNRVVKIQRHVYLLVEKKGLNLESVAKILGIVPEGARLHLRRAHEAVQELSEHFFLRRILAEHRLPEDWQDLERWPIPKERHFAVEAMTERQKASYLLGDLFGLSNKESAVILSIEKYEVRDARAEARTLVEDWSVLTAHSEIYPASRAQLITLPSFIRSAVIPIVVLGKAEAEVAEALHLPTPDVTERLHRAYVTLPELLHAERKRYLTRDWDYLPNWKSSLDPVELEILAKVVDRNRQIYLMRRGWGWSARRVADILGMPVYQDAASRFARVSDRITRHRMRR